MRALASSWPTLIIYFTNFSNTYDFQNLYLTWSQTNDIGFNRYNIYYSNLVSNEDILIYSTQIQSDTSIVISDFSLQE